MPRNGKLLVGVCALAAVLIVGCRDTPGPTELRPAAAAFGRGSAPGAGVVLGRTTRLGAESAARFVGAKGGVITLPNAGLTLYVPPGALGGEPVQITVTAEPGSAVAYQFEPHGLRFAVPVVVEQDVHGTGLKASELTLGSVQGAYYEGRVADGSAVVREMRPSWVDVGHGKVRFTAEHFSGYLVSVGRSGP